MRKSSKEKVFPNTFKILTEEESITSAIGIFFGSVTFFLTPVGMTVFCGELVTRHIKDPVQRASLAISTMDGLTNASYIAVTLIPLISIGLPLSATAIRPT